MLLAVPYNRESDTAFEFELRRLKDELPTENFYSQLKDYLHQKDWRKADEETTWLFYVVMVKLEYEDWDELCLNFPSEILNEIDQLWVNHSKGKFGFSIQKRIWKSLVGQANTYLEEKWINFGKQVEWYGEKDWKDYNSLSFSIKSVDGNLPARWITLPIGWLKLKPGVDRDLCMEEMGWREYDLFSRIKI